ncbi:MAG: hypothetical protein JXA22_00555 [Candidatus Thermoplasmatota archaeon]|nr:hypothetical protein [Candidatus Thermoplasmatota archaeon]
MDLRSNYHVQFILIFLLLSSSFSAADMVTGDPDKVAPVNEILEFIRMEETIDIQNGFPLVSLGDNSPEVRMDGLEMDPRPSYLRLPIIMKELVLPLGSRNIEVSLEDAFFTYIPYPTGLGINPHPVPKVEGASPIVPEGGFLAPARHVEHRTMTGIDQETFETRAYMSISISPVVPEDSMLRCLVSGVVKISFDAPIDKIWYEPSEYDVLVICPDEFIDTAGEYATYRNATGKYTKVVTMSDIRSDRYWTISENDTQEEIKRFIYQARLNWGIDFVLLAGDEEHIPTRHILVLDGYDDSGAMHTDGAFVPSDLYYSDLFEDGTTTFTSWNADNSGNSRYLWGEYDGSISDDPDLYPDVFVGRLPASDEQEFLGMFEKIRGYELEAKGSDWFYNATLCGTNTFTENPTPEGEYTCDYIESHFLDGFNVTKLYETTVNLFNISKVIDQGTGLVVFSDHGDYDGWGYTSSYPSGAYRSTYANNQKNGYKLPIAVLDACLTHGFDNENASDPVSGKDPVYDQWYYPPGSGLDERDCLGEYLNTNKVGGAIATFGCTRVGYGSLGVSYPTVNSGYFNVRLNKAFAEGVNTPGQVLAQAQKDFIMNIGTSGVTLYKTITEYVLLGDPSLNIGGITGTNVEIIPEKENITVAPGTEAEMDFSVRNIGIIPTEVDLNITVEGNGKHVWTANISIENGSIPAGGSLEGTIFIYAPPGVLFNQKRDIILRVDSILLLKPRTYTIEAFAMRTEGVALSLDPPDLSASQGSEVIGFVNVENLGNGPENFNINFPDIPEGWEVEMSSFLVEVDPFSGSRFPFKLTLPDRFLAGTETHIISAVSAVTGASTAMSFNMTVEPDLSFDLSMPVLVVEMLPEENFTIPFDLIGSGNVDVEVDIDWYGTRLEGWDIRVINGSQVLLPFTNGTGGLYVRPPEGTDPGVYSIYVTADNGVEEKEAIVDIIILKMYGFSLTAEEEVQMADPGERISFFLNISNIGNIYDQYNLTMTAFPEGNWTIALNPRSFSVAKGSWKRVYLDITSEFPENGTYLFSVEVSPWSGGMPRSVDLLVEIRKSFGFDLRGEFFGPEVLPGSTFEAVLDLWNLGNTNDLFFINASMEKGWPVSLSMTNMSLNSSMSGRIGITLDIPEETLAGSYILSLSVRSEGAGTFRNYERTIFVDEVYSLIIEADLQDLVVRTRPGKMVQFDVTVWNMGNAIDSVDIGISSSSYMEEWISLSSSNFNRIDPGDNRTFQVIIDVPGDIIVGEYHILIWVGSNGDIPAERLNLTVKVEEKGAAALFSRIDPLPILIASIAGIGMVLLTVFMLVRIYRRTSGMDLENAGMEWEEDEEEADWE